MNDKLRKILTPFIDMPDDLISVVREIEEVFTLTDKEKLKEGGW